MRRSPRSVALWCSAGAVAIITTSVVGHDLSEVRQRARQLGAEHPVVVARRDLRVGETVRPVDFVVRVLHASDAPIGALPSARRAVGKVIAVPVLRGNVVLARHVGPSAIRRGMRLMRVPVDALPPRSVFTRVDLVATVDGESIDATRIVAHEAVVVDARAVAGKPMLSIIVPARDVRPLAFAAAHAVLTPVVVPPDTTDAQ